MLKKMVIALVLGLFIVAPAMASDKIIDEKIQSATISIDKNGAEYMRLIVPETREIQGIEYQVGAAIMVFGKNVPAAKKLKTGDNLKAIVSSHEYRGRTSYTVVAFIKKK